MIGEHKKVHIRTRAIVQQVKCLHCIYPTGFNIQHCILSPEYYQEQFLSAESKVSPEHLITNIHREVTKYYY